MSGFFPAVKRVTFTIIIITGIIIIIIIIIEFYDGKAFAYARTISPNKKSKWNSVCL